MKKNRLIAALLAVVTALAATGCSAPEVAPTFDKTVPWATPTNYERSLYTVEKFTRVQNGKTTENGECVTVTELNPEDGKPQSYMETTVTMSGAVFTVETNFRITYIDSDAADDEDSMNGKKIVNRGLTDTMTSVVRFNEDMTPTYSAKTFTLAERPTGDDYASVHGYSYVVDYSAKTLTGTTRNAKGETVEKEIAIESGIWYDNEQLLFVARRLQAASDKGSATFYLTNGYDMMLKDTYFRYNMSFASGDKTGVTLSTDISGDRFRLQDTGKKENDGSDGILTPAPQEGGGSAYLIDCTTTTIGINSSSTKTPGPPIVLLLSDPGITFAESLGEGLEPQSATTCKLVVRMTTVEYSVDAKEKFNTVYSLKDYTVNPSRK